MHVSYKLLKQFVDLEGIKLEDLVSQVTIAGVEIENVIPLSNGNNLVVGEVLQCVNHPTSDHLHVCQVNIGKEITQIVCGAPNVAVGQKVIVARPGADLKAKGLVIQKSVIRGIESNGMICSLLELGVDKQRLNEQQIAGIEVLPRDAVIGDENPLAFLGLDDVIFELKPTPNRGDVLSLLSFAYDVAAIMKRPVLYKQEQIATYPTIPTTVKATSLTPHCHYFNVQKVNNIVVKPSPKWLQECLLAANIHPVNNIVDIGNYVMLILGQPIHIYDADALVNSQFTIEENYTGNLEALDENQYLVKPGDLVICAGGRVECLAGVMGAKSSMIQESTKNVIVEAAVFNPIAIRKTSRRLQLFSDSSTRFVRGIDEARSKRALLLVIDLLKKEANAKTIEDLVTFGEPKIHNQRIELSLKKLNNVLGTHFTSQEVASAFERLHYTYTCTNDIFLVSAPSYRKDLVIAEDLIEEVIRILGFEHLPSIFPVAATIGGLNELQMKRRLIRDHLTYNGLHEAISYSLLEAKVINDFCVLSSHKNKVMTSLALPMSEEHAHMRLSLIPSLLKDINYNQARKNGDVSLFEIGKVYPLHEEHELLGIALSGELRSSKWLGANPSDYYQVKGMVESIFNLLGIEEKRYSFMRVEEDNRFYHPGRSAYIVEGKKILGVIGQIHPNMEKQYDVKPTFVAEIDLDHVWNWKISKTKFAAPSIYPPIKRDIALVLAESNDASALLKSIKKVGKDKIAQVEVFDVYQGDHIEKGFKSIAITIVYQDKEKTMLEAEVNEIHNQILTALAKDFDAQLRK